MSSPTEEHEPQQPRQAIPRTAKQIIDQAIRENKLNERLLYLYSFVFVAAGTTALICGMIQGQGIVALAGAIANVLFYPAMRMAREIRRENIAIRLVENPLSMAHTAKEASDTLREFFADTFIKRNPHP